MFRNLFCVFIAIFWTTALFPVTLVFALAALDFNASFYVVRHLWSPVLLWAGGARLRVHGLEHADFTRPAIYVANHQSTLDIPALFFSLPVPFRFAAKKQLQYVPVIGWYMTLAQFIFIDRRNHTRAVRSLAEASRRIRGGISIAMFAEGTRSDDQTVMPFKKGPFALAMEAGVPVVPVAIEGSGRLMPKNSWNITPGPVDVAIGTPIDPGTFEGDREALMRAVRDQIIDLCVAHGGKGGDKATVVARKGALGRAGQDLE